jgi:hypothetical protein
MDTNGHTAFDTGTLWHASEDARVPVGPVRLTGQQGSQIVEALRAGRRVHEQKNERSAGRAHIDCFPWLRSDRD